MSYFQIEKINELSLEKDNLKELGNADFKKMIRKYVEDEVFLLDSLSINYQVISKGTVHFNSGDNYVYLPIEDICKHTLNYHEIILHDKENSIQLDEFTIYARDIVRMIICHEASHALSESLKKINLRAKELIDDLINYLIELNYKGIYWSEKELYETKYEEEVHAWRLGKEFYQGNSDLYEYIKNYELGSYRSFIKKRMAKLQRRIIEDRMIE